MKKQSFALMVIFSGLFILSQYGCSKSDSSGTPSTPTTVDCSGVNPGFSADVLPLMTTKCAINSGCHATGSTNSGGPLTTYAQISAKASNIKSQVSSGAMPQTGSLTSTQKATIICWVNNGAANN